MKKLFTLKFITCFLFCASLAFSLSRCSPISSSILKAGVAPSEAIEVSLAKLIPIKTRIIDEDQAELEALLEDEDAPGSATLYAVNVVALPNEAAPAPAVLTEDQVTEFRNDGKVEITIPKGITRGEGTFVVKWQGEDSSVQDRLDFNTEVVRGDDGKGTLRVVGNVPKDISVLIRNRLVSASINWSTKVN